MTNIDVIRKAITSYKTDKQKITDILDKRLKKRKKITFGHSWDSNINGDIYYFDIKTDDRQINWIINVSAENIAKNNVVIEVYRKEGGRWEEYEPTEISIENKAPEVIADEILSVLKT